MTLPYFVLHIILIVDSLKGILLSSMYNKCFVLSHIYFISSFYFMLYIFQEWSVPDFGERRVWTWWKIYWEEHRSDNPSFRFRRKGVGGQYSIFAICSRLSHVILLVFVVASFVFRMLILSLLVLVVTNGPVASFLMVMSLAIDKYGMGDWWLAGENSNTSERSEPILLCPPTNRDCPEIEAGPPQWEASRLPKLWHGHFNL